jgi:hypothetical protein
VQYVVVQNMSAVNNSIVKVKNVIFLFNYLVNNSLGIFLFHHCTTYTIFIKSKEIMSEVC